MRLGATARSTMVSRSMRAWSCRCWTMAHSKPRARLMPCRRSRIHTGSPSVSRDRFFASIWDAKMRRRITRCCGACLWALRTRIGRTLCRCCGAWRCRPLFPSVRRPYEQPGDTHQTSELAWDDDTKGLNESVWGAELLAHAGGARNGLRRGWNVRVRAALRDVLQGRVISSGVDQACQHRRPERHTHRGAAATRCGLDFVPRYEHP